MKPRIPPSTCLNLYLHTLILTILTKSACPLLVSSWLKDSLRTCFWAPLHWRKFISCLGWLRRLVWMHWNRLLKLRDIVSQFWGATVGTWAIQKLVQLSFILSCCFWKVKQGQIKYGLDSALSSDLSTDCDALSDTSKAVIIHPCHSTWITNHPKYNPFTLLDPIPSPPVYQKTTPLIEDLVTKLSISLKE